MASKLIPLELLSDGKNTISCIGKDKSNACSVWLSKSIVKDGLLNPLVVIKQESKYVVIDGRKRLAVIRQLAKTRVLPKTIAKVPCIVQDAMDLKPHEYRRPILMNVTELAHKILIDVQSAVSLVSIAQRYECHLSVVEDCISLTKLHPEILLHFNTGAISLEQAAALATIGNMKAQLDLLHQLGPFVSNTEIIAAIRAGVTVIELSEDNIIFLPSRESPDSQKSQQEFEFDKGQPYNASRSERLVA